MRNLFLNLTLFILLFSTSLMAQETFEKKAKAIALKIENITQDEKNALKKEIEEINIQLGKQLLTKELADTKKQELAKNSALNIEIRIAEVQKELNQLVQEKVDGKIAENSERKNYSEINFGNKLILKMEEVEKKQSKKGENSLTFKMSNDSIKKKHKTYQEKRTTTQFVFAAGLNNLVTDHSIDNSDFKSIGSHFYEWGATYKIRLLKNDNLLHLKYGFSVMYNNLRPKDNNYFVKNGDQTNLIAHPNQLKDARFKNVYLVAPLHLEFDFSGNQSKYGNGKFRTQESFRLGVGGYAGIHLKSKQMLRYEVDNLEIRQKIKGDYNANDFIYGLSSYIGYKNTSLYLKYDLNSMFDNNPIKQQNVSLGLRFDWN
ncbi:MAG: hypothetical protein Q7U08_06320 [Flavobacteriaceae bacterium]|nr:hypothetical protein [Flavobacteriaceae bacterium]